MSKPIEKPLKETKKDDLSKPDEIKSEDKPAEKIKEKTPDQDLSEVESKQDKKVDMEWGRDKKKRTSK